MNWLSMLVRLGISLIWAIGFIFSGPKLLGQSNFVGLDPQKSLTQYTIDSWDSEDGLPSNAILAITKGEDGYLWLATYGGLTRFDGIDFQVYDTLFDVAGIRSLYSDKQGHLWVGSNGDGLLQFKDQKFGALQTDSLLTNSIVSAFAEDQQGVIWIGTRNGLARYIDEKIQPEEDSLVSNATIYAIYVDANNHVYIGTSGQGLVRYSDGRYEQITSDQGLINNSVRSILTDRQGNLWVGTEGGITRFNKYGHQSFTTEDGLPHGYINEIYEDSRGSLWFGTDGGLARYSNEVFEVITQSDGLSDNTIEAITEDEEGSLWVGSYHGGLNRIKDGNFRNFSVPEGLTHEIVNAVYPDDSKIWVGTDEGLSVIEDGKVKSYSLGADPSINKIRDIYRDTRGHLWICTSGGLVRFENGVQQVYHEEDGLASNRIRRITEDRSGNLWIGTAQGLNRLAVDGTIATYGTAQGLNNEFIMAVLVDHDNNIWVGTNGGGLGKLNGEQFEVFTKDNGLASDVIFSLTEDRKNRLWIATNGGLSRLENEVFSSITHHDGLISNTIFQIMEDHVGNLWLLFDKGVTLVDSLEVDDMFNSDISSLWDARLFNKSDGMRTSQITSVSVGAQNEAGHILIPTIKGISILDPVGIHINQALPPVRLQQLIADNKVLSFEDENLTLEPGTKNLEIHYAGLSFFAPDKVRYRYKLIDFDDDWIEVGGRRVAYYTNLPAGEYHFQVQAANNDGLWNDVGASFDLQQKAYFYQTTWFYFCLVIGLGLVATLIHLLRLRRLEQRNQNLAKLVEDRTLDIEQKKQELEKLNEVKDKLFSIVSHDLRSPINSCSMMFQLLGDGHMTEQEFLGMTGKMSEKVGQLGNLLDNLLNWSKSQMDGLFESPEAFELKGLVNDDLKLARAQASFKEIVLENKVSEGEKVWADKDMIKLVLRNLISNAIKFTPEHGSVTVAAESRNGHVEVSVSDTGVGISEADKNKLFDQGLHHSTPGTNMEGGTGLGLILVKEFVDRNEGHIWVEDTPGGGSTFKFRLNRPVAVKV